ncbi:MAG TPA: PHP domain-containing protein [Vicinamibacterales bacterium]|jgi:DNA polymerase (family 10)
MIRGDAAEEALLAEARTLVAALDIANDADLGHLFDAPSPPGDPAVMKRLRQMYEAGGWVLVESTLADLPADLRWLYESGAVTLEQLAALHHAHGVTTSADLAAILQDGRLNTVSGFDAATESSIAGALPTLRSSIPRIPLGRAVSIAEPILDRLRRAHGTLWASTTGSLRRGQDMVGDIELLASTTAADDGIAAVLDDRDVVRTLHRGADRVYVRVDRTQVGVRMTTAERAGIDLLRLTGSAQHLDALRLYAAEKGFQLTAAGLIVSPTTTVATSEEDIYDALGLPFIPPEVREGDDEIDAASRGSLPALVARADIRGDLHMHTVWSDGRDSVEAMVLSCKTLGYQYMAITDHSPSSAAVRNLTVDDVSKQADEIARLREANPEIVILHGCEVDILEDGRLDFPDRVLERFDVVLASLHERAGHARDRLMKRYASAMKHPLVTTITHPTNRMVPNRPGYDLDYDRLFEMATETNTVVEIDGSPSHLDLDGALARRAIARGAVVAIDSDCHRADMLQRQMDLGIVMARRGWVEPRHVLNTRSLDDVRGHIARKRSGR